MGLLADGQTWLKDVMSSEGQTITITRGATSVSLKSMPDDPQEGEINKEGLVVQLTSRMFAVNVVDLGALGMPQANDKITWGSTTFQVLPINDGRCYEFLDNRNSRISIHAKRVGQ